jgi:hypothetical protein
MDIFGKVKGAVQNFASQNPGIVKTVVAGAGAAAGVAFGKNISGGSTLGAVAGGLIGGQLGNAVATRLAGAGINPAAMNSPLTKYFSRIDPQITFGSGTRNIGSGQQDWRVKVVLPPGSPIFGGAFASGALNPLANDKGVVFPHTPTVSLTHSARYESQSLVHTNYTFYNYTGSETGAITDTADFTAQSINEARYLLASVYFFRSCTKMFYGSGEYVGNPPPIVFLSGYGKFMLPRTPCVITQFSHTLPNDVDYMVDTPGPDSNSDTSWVPTYTQLSITLQPVVSRNKQGAFNLNAFAAGQLLSTGPNGAAGGFL